MRCGSRMLTSELSRDAEPSIAGKASQSRFDH